MKNNNYLLYLLSVMGFFACAPQLTMEGAHVKLVESTTDVASCQGIGNAEGQGNSKDNAEIAIRNHAGTMNADIVVVKETIENGEQVKVTGKAFAKCANAQ